MLDMPVATLWLWGTVAAVAVATGVMPLTIENVMLFTLPEGFYLGCGIFEIPTCFICWAIASAQFSIPSGNQPMGVW